MKMNEIPKDNSLVNEIIINENRARVVTSFSPRHENTFYEKTEPYTIKASISTRDFFNILYKSINKIQLDEILPDNCKFIRRLNNGKKILVLEDEPQIRTITINKDMFSVIEKHKETGKYNEYELENINKEKPYRFTLSFPYIIYIVSLTDKNEYTGMSIFFRLNPLTSLQDYLLEPCLPNISNEYNLCLGYYSPQNPGSLSSEVRNIIDNFWFNEFNSDYWGLCEKYKNNPELTDFFTWQYNTKKDPLFIFSTKWRPVQNNLKIKDMVDRYGYDSNQIGQLFPGEVLSKLKNLISIERKIDEEGSHTEIFRDFVESINCNGMVISVGDKIIHNNKEYYVLSFNANNEKIDYVVLEDEDGKESKIKLINISPDQFEKVNPRTLKISDNLEISVGDLILFKINNEIRSVDKIIESKGSYQIKIGNDFYLISSFFAGNIEKFDKTKPFKLNDTELVEGNEYFIDYTSYSNSLFSNLEKIKFLKHEVINGNVIFNFKSNVGGTFRIDQNDKNINFIEGSKIRFLQMYRVGNKIYTNDLTNNDPKEKIFLLNGKGVATLGYIYRKDYYEQFPTISSKYRFLKLNIKILLNILTEACKENVITIPSFDRDITFRKDEEVITVDWNNPNEMLKIKKILSFSIKDGLKFLIDLIDEDGKVSSFELINLSSGLCNVASIRKVCREINDIKVGMKAKAKAKGIQDFPMKDCNEIKAFIIDEDVEPLVLMSNYRTIYFNDLSLKFNLFNSENPKFKKLEISEPSLKIKCCDFDLFMDINYNNLYIYTNDRIYNIDGYIINNLPRDWNVSSLSGGRFRRIGIILPRYTEQEFFTLKSKIGGPTIFSNVIKNKQTVSFHRDWRDDKNV